MANDERGHPRLTEPQIRELEQQLKDFDAHLRDGGYALRTRNTKLGGAEWFVRFLAGQAFNNKRR